MNYIYCLKTPEGRYIRLEKARSHKYVSRKPDGKGGWIYTYYKKPNENSHALNYEDIREFGYEKALQIYYDTESIRNKLVEHSIVYDNKGNRFFSKIGSDKDVNFTEQEQEIIKNSRLMIHNHPNNSYLSDKDFNLLLKLNINEIRAVGVDKNLKTNFYVKKIEINNKERILFREKYITDVSLLLTDLKQKNFLGLISAKEANKEFNEKSVSLFDKYNKGYYKHGKF